MINLKKLKQNLCRLPGTLAEEMLSVYASGPCEIDIARRELRISGTPVPISARAFEIIEILVQTSGGLVSKDELMHHVWPGAIVNDNTLQVHVSAVRKALGSHRALLRTESGRGYRLLGDWTRRDQTSTPRSPVDVPTISAREASTNLPEFITPLIGRSSAAALLRELVSAYRIVTLTGPGGIGKTTLALHVARSVLTEFEDGVWLVELASLADPELVPSAVAGVLRLDLGGVESSAAAIARAIGRKNLLLIIDNCEHLINATATLAESLVRSCPRTTILTTSREVLRIDGEYVYRVPPLDVPEHDTLPNVLDHSAIELFIARVQALDSDFSPASDRVPLIAAICRQLDGIPLAIEFAAARAAALGVIPVARGLRDRFTLLTGGRRTALPRHRTLRAVVEWSHGLLSRDEQQFFRTLGIFAGGFTVEAVAAVAIDATHAAREAIDLLADLVAKSLVVADVSGVKPRFRLLDTTRAYAIEQLEGSGERESRARRAAEYYRNVFEPAKDKAAARPEGEWLADCAREIDNLRAALDWAFSPGGDASIGVALTAGAVPLWRHLLLIDECRIRVERALASYTAERDGPEAEMKLHAARAASLMYAKGPVLEANATWAHALRLAETLDDTEYQLRALWGMSVYRLYRGEYHASLELAHRFTRLAANVGDSSAVLIGTRTIGTALHYLGDQSNARRQFEDVLSRYDAPARRSHIIRYQFDQQVTARVTLSQVMWIQGFADQAIHTAESAVDQARAAGQTLSLCNALSQAACSIALFVGNLAAADRFIGMLLDHSARHSLELWHVLGRCWDGVRRIRRGDVTDGLPLLRASRGQLRQMRFALRDPFFSGVLAEGLAADGQTREALSTVDEALAVIDRTGERWCLPELLRLKGELLLLQGAPGVAEAAEDHFRQALDWARREGALSWELRAATSFARLRQIQDRPADAIACLRPVYDRFTEGFGTADLVAATQLLDELSSAGHC